MKSELKKLLLNKNFYLFLCLSLSTILAGNFITYEFFEWLALKKTKTGSVNIMVDGPFPKVLNIYGPCLGVFFLAALCLAIECLSLGWEKSSLKRLINPKNATRKTDLFYLVFAMSGLKPLFAILFTFGASHFVYTYSQKNISLGLIHDWHFAPAFLVIFFMNTFLFYLVHRLMHTSFFWEIHKIHHSATELNIITPHRNHPLDFALVTILNSIPGAILGAPYESFIAYVIFNGTYQQLVHTEMKWRPQWLGKYVFIDSCGHKLHHSQSWKDLKSNFGILIFWDWVFGTWAGRESDNIKIGLKDQPNHNTGKPFVELFRIFWIFMRGGTGYGTIAHNLKKRSSLKHG